MSAENPYPYRKHIVAPILILLVSFPPPAYACKCAPPQPGFKCPSFPDTAATNMVIFVGSVTEVFPRSEEHMAELARQ